MLHSDDLQILDNALEKSESFSWSGATSYSEHLSFAAIESLLFALNPFPAETVKVVRTPEPAVDLVGGTVEDAIQAFAKGHSLILQSLQRRWTVAADIAGAIGRYLSVEARVNVYLTPPNACGFRKHYDDHDVLILQGEGKKEWNIFPPIPVLPVERTLLSQLQRGVLGFRLSDEVINLTDDKPTKCRVLHKNSFLYLPRGTPHQGLAGQKGSLHLSIALISPTYAEIMSLASLRRGSDAPVMRKLWRAGKSSLTFEEWIPSINDLNSIEAVLEIARQGSRRPLPGRALESICAINELNELSILQRRYNIQPWLGLFNDQTIFVFADKTLKVPGELMETFSFLSETSRFSVKELPLPGDIARVEFAGDLIQLGLVELG
jgi:hypothetical protein